MCRKYLNWVQNSVFKGQITEAKFERPRFELERTINPSTDSIRFYVLKDASSFKLRSSRLGQIRKLSRSTEEWCFVLFKIIEIGRVFKSDEDYKNFAESIEHEKGIVLIFSHDPVEYLYARVDERPSDWSLLLFVNQRATFLADRAR